MAAEQNPAGAVSHDPDGWYEQDFRKAQREVRRLQAPRVRPSALHAFTCVQAVQAKRWNKVKALQHLLTHSHSGRLLAVERVTENPGKKTAGVDGETWTTPEQKAQGVQRLKRRKYHPQPLRRVYIPKNNGKKRPLGIPTCVS